VKEGHWGSSGDDRERKCQTAEKQKRERRRPANTRGARLQDISRRFTAGSTLLKPNIAQAKAWWDNGRQLRPRMRRLEKSLSHSLPVRIF
jgi:hypothetical protein